MAVGIEKPHWASPLPALPIDFTDASNKIEAARLRYIQDIGNKKNLIAYVELLVQLPGQGALGIEKIEEYLDLHPEDQEIRAFEAYIHECFRQSEWDYLDIHAEEEKEELARIEAEKAIKKANAEHQSSEETAIISAEESDVLVALDQKTAPTTRKPLKTAISVFGPVPA